MHPFLEKTFFGLARAYYLRQLLFGMLVPGILILAACFTKSAPNTPHPPFATYICLIAYAFLYPYSRFVYDSIVDFIFGDNVFYLSIGWMLFLKWAAILICYFFAVFITPIGLLVLYIHHSKNEGGSHLGA